jgi:hypothetical protein
MSILRSIRVCCITDMTISHLIVILLDPEMFRVFCT